MVRSIIRAADPEQPVSNARGMTEIVARQTLSRAVQVRVLGAFAVIALVLAAGASTACWPSRSRSGATRIGVRMALGADPGRIVRGILRHSAVLAVAGLLPGVALAYAGGRAMESLLAGVTPADGVTFGVAAALCSVHDPGRQPRAGPPRGSSAPGTGLSRRLGRFRPKAQQFRLWRPRRSSAQGV